MGRAALVKPAAWQGEPNVVAVFDAYRNNNEEPVYYCDSAVKIFNQLLPV
jgi:hypothetical protein